MMKMIITSLLLGGLFALSKAGLSMIEFPFAEEAHPFTAPVNGFNPPAVSRIKITSTHSNHESLRMTCKATGENLLYDWTAETGALRNNEVAEENVLSINQVTKENDRIFCCKAFNTADSLTKCIRLPQLVIFSDPLERIVDSSAEMFCEVLGIDWKYDIIWKRADGLPLPRNTIINGGFLKIPKLSTMDTGIYVCVGLFYDKTEAFHQEISLEVLPPPNFIDVAIAGLDGSYDNDVMIECKAQFDETLTIKWRAHTEECTKGGTYLRPNEEAQEDTLIISNFQRDNEGTFCCIAISDLGTGEKCVTIGPLILEVYPKGPHEVTSGDSVTLECRSSTGYSNLEIDWTREDGQPFPPNVVKLANGSLTIRNMTIKDEGRYNCSATKGVLSASATADITVISPLLSEIEICAVGYRYSSKMTCHATGGRVSYMWTAEEGALLNNEVAEGNILTINNLTEDNYRIFCCEAFNSVGTRRRCKRLPEYVGWANSEGKVGSSVELECIIFGAEPQELDSKWSREHGLLLPKNATTAGYRLKIPKLAKTDAGTYFASIQYTRGMMTHIAACTIHLSVLPI